jgi:hypothetical protein
MHFLSLFLTPCEADRSGDHFNFSFEKILSFASEAYICRHEKVENACTVENWGCFQPVS